MASESKVADWLAQNDPTLVRSESTEDDSKSIKSDVPVHLKRLKGEGSVYISTCYNFIWFSSSSFLSLTEDFNLHTEIIFPCELSISFTWIIIILLVLYLNVWFYTLSQMSMSLPILCENWVYSLLGREVAGCGNHARGLAANRQKHLNPYPHPMTRLSMSSIAQPPLNFAFCSHYQVSSTYSYTTSWQLRTLEVAFGFFSVELSVWTCKTCLFTSVGLLLCFLGVKFGIAMTVNCMLLCVSLFLLPANSQLLSGFLLDRDFVRMGRTRQC